MTAATALSTEHAREPIGTRRWLLLAIAFLTSTLYAMTLLVVSVILPQIQGSLSATPDQIAWTMTFNILATAIVTPISGRLAGRFGARNVMMFCMAGFGVASLACGFATSLEMLVFFRILHGGLGAPLVPLPQAVVLAAFPKSQHAVATSIYGMGVVLGPVLGPVYGGYLAELYGWRAAFFMIAPMALAILIGIYFLIPRNKERLTTRFTWFGFMALATGLTCLQLILDRGQRLDWLDSPEIVAEIVIGLMGLGIFIAHNLLARTPLLDFQHLRNWNYVLGLLIVTVYGMLNFTPMVMLPPMLKDLGGYPETIIGTLVSFRGVGAVIGFFLAARLNAMVTDQAQLVGFLNSFGLYTAMCLVVAPLVWLIRPPAKSG